MKTSYLSTVGGVLLTALPLVALLNGCGGGGGGNNNGPRPTATPTFGPTPTTASSPIPTTTTEPGPTATATATATPTATSTPAPTSTPRPTPTPAPTTVYNFTLNQSTDSNYSTTFNLAITGSKSSSIGSTSIDISSSYNSRGTSALISIALSSSRPIQIGDVFKANDPSFKANVSSRRAFRGAVSMPVRFLNWNNASDATGEVIVRALTAKSVTLELKDVVISSVDTNAEGSVTFNGTVQTTING